MLQLKPVIAATPVDPGPPFIENVCPPEDPPLKDKSLEGRLYWLDWIRCYAVFQIVSINSIWVALSATGSFEEINKPENERRPDLDEMV